MNQRDTQTMKNEHIKEITLPMIWAFLVGNHPDRLWNTACNKT